MEGPPSAVGVSWAASSDEIEQPMSAPQPQPLPLPLPPAPRTPPLPPTARELLGGTDTPELSVLFAHYSKLHAADDADGADAGTPTILKTEFFKFARDAGLMVLSHRQMSERRLGLTYDDVADVFYEFVAEKGQLGYSGFRGAAAQLAVMYSNNPVETSAELSALLRETYGAQCSKLRMVSPPQSPSQSQQSKNKAKAKVSLRSCARELIAASYPEPRRLFAWFDRDRSGTLEYDEFERGVRRLGSTSSLKLSNEDMAAVLALLDSNGDGMIRTEDFSRFLGFDYEDDSRLDAAAVSEAAATWEGGMAKVQKSQRRTGKRETQGKVSYIRIFGERSSSIDALLDRATTSKATSGNFQERMIKAEEKKRIKMVHLKRQLWKKRQSR